MGGAEYPEKGVIRYRPAGELAANVSPPFDGLVQG
jgi:hypothetical protein